MESRRKMRMLRWMCGVTKKDEDAAMRWMCGVRKKDEDAAMDVWSQEER